MFTEYGRLALDETGETPFQKLQFLVRDWIDPDNYPFGSDGGEQLIKKLLRVNNRLKFFFLKITCLVF